MFYCVYLAVVLTTLFYSFRSPRRRHLEVLNGHCPPSSASFFLEPVTSKRLVLRPGYSFLNLIGTIPTAPLCESTILTIHWRRFGGWYTILPQPYNGVVATRIAAIHTIVQ